ncbi:hypothetical protein EG832_08565 [bacterium]|nr:hypothetical protein [bacterium]
MDHINNIFDNLDSWRNLPAYQLERRADIFFSIYLADILFHHFSVSIDGLIPEFPVRVGTIYENADNKSFKIDYLARVKDSNRLFFVELKTDQSSRRDTQDQYLERARLVGFAELLEGLRKIYRATASKKKYMYLLEKLQDLGFLHLDQSGAFEIIPALYEIEIVYIQPNDPYGLDNVITFAEVAEIVERHGDAVSQRFARSLVLWANQKAGEKLSC